MKKLLVISLLILLSIPAVSLHAKQIASKNINDIYVIHLVVDGINQKIFYQALESGKMPNIKELFVGNGAVFTDAVSLFPTVSTTVYQSFTTGLFPGNAGIPHLERLVREKEKVIGYLTFSGSLKINDDFINLKALQNPDVAELNPPSTIFELLSGHPTLSLYSPFRLGASIKIPKRFPLRALWDGFVEHRGDKIDLLAFNKLLKIFKMKNPPRYSLVGLYSADFEGHYFGESSDEVEDTLEQLDLLVKEFWELIEKRGLAQKTYLIISADHGMHDIGKQFEIQKLLFESGILANYALYAVDRGVASTQIYIKDGETKNNTGVDLIKLILDMEPAQMVISRDKNGSVRIFTDNGESLIECYNLNSTDWCSYTIISGKADPLSYTGNPKLTSLLDGKPHPSREWLARTAHTEFPDAVVSLHQIFRDGRAGDIFVIPKKEWGFRGVKAATHGSIITEDMKIPMLMRGPTVPKGSFGVMRASDIYPLLIDWFGLDLPKENYDGVNPFEKRETESQNWCLLAELEQLSSKGKKINKMASAKHNEISFIGKKELSSRKTLLKKLKIERERLSNERPANDHLQIIDRIIRLTEERIVNMERVLNSI